MVKGSLGARMACAVEAIKALGRAAPEGPAAEEDG
jgi:hypothetical protein